MVLDSDRLAHEVLKKGNKIYPQVCSLFPELKGNLSRAKIAQVVFGDPQKRRALESRVHPYVFQRIHEEVARTPKEVVVLEVPLLFETGLDSHCDFTVVVDTPLEKVLRRLGQKGYLPSDIEARWRAQMPVPRKISKADERIDNSRGRAETRRQVNRIWRKLKERSLTKHG